MNSRRYVVRPLVLPFLPSDVQTHQEAEYYSYPLRTVGNSYAHDREHNSFWAGQYVGRTTFLLPEISTGDFQHVEPSAVAANICPVQAINVSD